MAAKSTYKRKQAVDANGLRQHWGNVTLMVLRPRLSCGALIEAGYEGLQFLLPFCRTDPVDQILLLGPDKMLDKDKRSNGRKNNR